MPVTAASLVAKVSVDGADKAKSDLVSVGGTVNKVGSSLGTVLAGAAVAGGAALIGIGVASVKAAGNFQEGMTSLITGAGESQKNLKAVSDGILNIATQTGANTKQLTDGMYMIESAGFHGAAGLSVLQAAAEGAKVGNADLGTVAGAVTTVMHDYAASHISATQATNALITTVASGKTHMEDLSSSLAAILPLASSLHIPFEQVAGAVATMTNAGMPAQQATQNLAFAVRALNVETPKGADALKQFGLSAEEVHNTLVSKGLPTTLQMIEDHIGKQFPLSSMQGQQALKDIMGGAVGLNVALMVGGDHMKEYTSDIDSIGSALKSGSKDVQGWADVQKDFNFKISQAKEVIETLSIKIGTALLPIASQAVGIFTTMATVLSDRLGAAFNYVSNAIKTIHIDSLANAFLIMHNAVSFVALGLKDLFNANVAPFSNAISFLKDELGALFNIVGKVIGIVVNQFASSFSDASSSVLSFARGMTDVLYNALVNITQGMMHLNQYLNGLDLSKISGDISQLAGLLGGQFRQALQFVSDEARQIGQWFQSSVVPALKQAEPGFANLAQVILGTVLPALIQIRGVVMDVAEHAFKALLPIIEMLIPPLIVLAGNIANGLAVALRVIAPIVVGVVKGIGDLANFLIGILAPVIKQIVVTFNTQLLPAIMGLMPAFRALQPLLTGVAVVIGGVLAIALGLLVGLFVGVVKGAAALLTGLIQAFGGIVQMISGAVQIISGIIGLLVDIFTGNFSHIKADLQSFVSGVLSLFTGFGNVFMGIFGGLFLGIWGLVSGFVQGVIGFFMHLYDTLVGHSIIPDMVNGIISWFQQLPGRALAAISSLASSIGGFFSNLAGQALAWGSDLVNGIASGITSSIGSVISAASNVASAISSILHHTKPEIGPLAHDDEWMPDFMESLASGMNSNLGKVKNASLNVATTIAGSQSSFASPTGGLGGLSVVPRNVQAGSGNVQITVQPAPIYLDGRVLASSLLPHTVNAIRSATGTRNF